jgi:hypothetical protein
MAGEALFHVECRVGRLLEIRPESLQSVEAVTAIGVAISRAVRVAGGGALLFCVDWRRLRVLAPDVVDALTLMIKGGNSRTVRSAALISEHATFGLQVERVLRTANNPARRAFRDPELLLEWIAEVATNAELTRARAFLLGSAAH